MFFLKGSFGASRKPRLDFAIHQLKCISYHSLLEAPLQNSLKEKHGYRLLRKGKVSLMKRKEMSPQVSWWRMLFSVNLFLSFFFPPFVPYKSPGRLGHQALPMPMLQKMRDSEHSYLPRPHNKLVKTWTQNTILTLNSVLSSMTTAYLWALIPLGRKDKPINISAI